ncbi:MAG: hypothetical protein L0Z70_15955 [Chloroflexi bacterium]|nr:hypothetical protein [Chloroflexota bacterium]
MRRILLPVLTALWLLSACLRPASTPSPAPGEAASVPPGATPSLVASPLVAEASSTPAVVIPTSAPIETPPLPPAGPPEVPVQLLPLAGPLSAAQAEISGMAWYQDNLILLPQYPNRFGSGDGALFAIPKAEILARLDGSQADPLVPQEIPFYAPDLEGRVRGFEGFEAIAFNGENVYLTIEAHPWGMMGYLIAGYIAPDLSAVTLNTANLSEIPPQADILNFTDETLLIFGYRLVTLYEANGAQVNPHPAARLFDASLQPQDSLSMPNVEYRLTDATPPDDSGRFWAINFFYTGDKKIAADFDPLAAAYGEGATHAKFDSVERLVEFQFTEDGLVFSDSEPIQLELLGDELPRNWEAIARLDERGFLLATDKFPTTLLGFVPYIAPQP